MTVEKRNDFKINLLGPWQVTKNGEPLTDFRGDSVRALLTYLVLENSSPQSRRFLASFLWEELDEEAAMRNVRVSLTRLRKGLGDDVDKSPLLYVDRQSVGIDPRATYTLDTDQFEQAIAHGRRSIEPGRPPDRRVLARLKRAVDLYRADFLQGFTHPSNPFEDWMLVRRERFHGDALWALHVLANHALRIQDWHAAVNYAQRQINLEAWREEGFQQLIQAQIGLGERSAAIASYERCKQVLWDELGVEPDHTTELLAQQVRDGGQSSNEEVASVPHNLPTAGTNFFSRETEIDFLLNRIGDPDGRLTTILGEGGIGKSRLSQYVGRRVLRDFKDGVWFVPLDHIEIERSESIAPLTRNSQGIVPIGEDEIVRLMIDTLGIPLAGNRPDREQLLAWLARKEILLILDNFEHLISAADLVNDILEKAAGAEIIVTSRIPLDLRQEAILPLKGLGLDGLLDKPNADPQALPPAVRMFFDRANRAGAAYELDEPTIMAVADTCEQVGGNALALELAAVWMRQMTATEIAAAVRESIDFLATRHRDMPERHRSMRAVFDQTWRLLTQDAQETFAKLSVFHGGFSADAAIDIVKTNRQMLGILQDRSLINRQASGRFTMRPLIRQYASGQFMRYGMLGMVRQYADEKLQQNGELAAEVEQAHAAWYLAFMAEQKPDLMGEKPWEAIERIELDIENIRKGWQTACATLNTDVGVQRAGPASLLKAAEPLSEYYNIRGRFQEALDMFGIAAKAANKQQSTDILQGHIDNQQSTNNLHAHATMHEARFLVRMGKYKDGVEQGKRAVRLARTADDDWCAAMGHVWWCQAFWEQGLTQEALEVLERGERFREKAGDRYLDGRFNHQYSVCYSIQGNSEQALKRSNLAIDTFSNINSVWHNAMSLNTLGIIHHERGDNDKAKSIYTKIINLLQPRLSPSFLAQIYSNLGISLQMSNEHAGAQDILNKALTIYEEMGLPSRELFIYSNLASILFDIGDLELAESHAKKAIELAKEFGNTRLETGSMMTLGNVSLAKRDYKTALAHFLLAAEVSDQNQFQQKKAIIIFGIAKCFLGLKEDAQANLHAKDALRLALATHQKELSIQIKETFANLNDS